MTVLSYASARFGGCASRVCRHGTRMAIWYLRERKELLRVEGNQEVKTMKPEKEGGIDCAVPHGAPREMLWRE